MEYVSLKTVLTGKKIPAVSATLASISSVGTVLPAKENLFALAEHYDIANYSVILKYQ
jgi:hypothetical protein